MVVLGVAGFTVAVFVLEEDGFVCEVAGKGDGSDSETGE